MQFLKSLPTIILLICLSVWLIACGSSDSNNGSTIYVLGGSSPAGGIVIHVTDGGLHGMEVAPINRVPVNAPGGSGAGTTGAWYGCDHLLMGASGTGVGTGEQNTSIVLAACSTPYIAAGVAALYELNGFTDWFVPSKDELDLVYLQKDALKDASAFANIFQETGNYFSSSEESTCCAWAKNFGLGNSHIDRKSAWYYLPLVRNF